MLLAHRCPQQPKRGPTLLVPVAQAPAPPVQTLRLRLKQGERVAPYPLPPLRLYPPVRLSRTLRYPRADVACGYRVVRGVLLAVGPLPVESRRCGGHFRPRKELFRPEGEEHVPGDRR